MKVSFSLTLEGMVRALRMRLHDVQENLDRDEPEPSSRLRPGEARRRRTWNGEREQDGSRIS
jgi:hypothetical protein